MIWYHVGLVIDWKMTNCVLITSDLAEAKFEAKMNNKAVYVKDGNFYRLLHNYIKNANVRDN